MTIFLDEQDIVIVSALRTPISKAKKGNFKDLTNDVLVYHAINGVMESTKLNPSIIDEVCFGHGLSPMNGTSALRVGALRCGIPIDVPMSTINRQCASGLDAIETIANKLKLDKIEVGLAGGFESMTTYSLETGLLTKMENDVKDVQDCFLSMGETAENLAKKSCITKEECDMYAFKSQLKAKMTLEEKKSEIIPIVVDGKVIDYDDGIRDCTLESVKKLRSCFSDNGVCSAGNSSQLSDGASAVLLMKRKTAKKLGLEVQAVYCDFTAVGVNPGFMGEGPVPAVRKLLQKNNLSVSDISYFEINEAFSCQALYCIKELGVEMQKVNKYGGAVALGHPIGCTGSRLIATALNVMKQEEIGGYCVISMCVGTGQGVACLLKKQ